MAHSSHCSCGPLNTTATNPRLAPRKKQIGNCFPTHNRIVKMDDDFGADDDLIAALAAAAPAAPARTAARPTPPSSRPSQPTPQRIQQPTPQRLDRAPPSAASGSKIVQPTPQALPSRSAGSSILVSPRQKGNPVLANIKSMPWEYSDIPADYGLGLTTCALFLRYVLSHRSRSKRHATSN